MSNQFFDKDNVIDIDVQKLQKKIFVFVPFIIVVLLLIIAAFNSIYMLQDKENGVVLRFGRVHEVVATAGLHIKIPFVDKVEIVDVKTIYSMEYGYRTTVDGTATSQAVYADNERESKVIVDGANNNASIAKIELIIQYVVSDPEDYLFKVEDVEGTLRLALEDAVRSSLQSLTLDEAKTQKDLIDIAVKPLLQKKMDDYGAGISIDLVATQNVQFLESVELAYQQKENANQYKNGKSEDSEKYYNTIIPQAEAEASKLIEEANAYKAETVANANAAVASFNALYTEYLNYPDILKEKYYIDAMTSYLMNNKIVIDATGSGDVYKFYNFDDSSIKQSVIN